MASPRAVRLAFAFIPVPQFMHNGVCPPSTLTGSRKGFTSIRGGAGGGPGDEKPPNPNSLCSTADRSASLPCFPPLVPIIGQSK